MLCILHTPRPAAKLVANRLWRLDLRVDGREVGSLGEAVLRWQARHGCFESRTCLIHLKGRHCDVVCVLLLADLESLLKDLFVTDYARIGVVEAVMLLLMRILGRQR